MRKALVVAASLVFFSAVTLSLPAQTPANASAAGKVNDLQWLAGRWSGEMFGQPCEEHWMKPDGKSMVGMFRLGPAGAKPVYEIMLIEEAEGALMFRLRHFGSKLVAWEKDDPVTMKLAKLSPKEAVFEPAGPTDLKRLLYRRESADKLRVELDMDREGKMSTVTSTLTLMSGE